MKIESRFDRDPQDREGEAQPQNPLQSVAKALAVDKGQEARFMAAMHSGFTPDDRIVQAAGCEQSATMAEFFVQPLSDTISGVSNGVPGIFDALRQAAETMRLGARVGYDFSPIRPKGAYVKGTGGSASGPISYMRLFDSMCETIVGDRECRGAQIGMLHVDHPDIEDFLDVNAAHVRPTLATFAMRVAVTDKFMDAVERDLPFDLVHEAAPTKDVALAANGVKGAHVYKTVRARELWQRIVHEGSEHLPFYIDRINRGNCLSYVETAAVSAFTGEGLSRYGSCMQGSMNLTKYVRNPHTDAAFFDYMAFEKDVAIAVEMLDRAIDVNHWPLPEQKSEAESKRRIVLSILGLAGAVSMLGIKQNSPASVEFADEVVMRQTRMAYRASCELAKTLGSFPFFSEDEYLAPGSLASRLPHSLKADIRKHGLRNGQLVASTFNSLAVTACQKALNP